MRYEKSEDELSEHSCKRGELYEGNLWKSELCQDGMCQYGRKVAKFHGKAFSTWVSDCQ